MTEQYTEIPEKPEDRGPVMIPPGMEVRGVLKAVYYRGEPLEDYPEFIKGVDPRALSNIELFFDRVFPPPVVSLLLVKYAMGGEGICLGFAFVVQPGEPNIDETIASFFSRFRLKFGDLELRTPNRIEGLWDPDLKFSLPGERVLGEIVITTEHMRQFTWVDAGWPALANWSFDALEEGRQAQAFADATVTTGDFAKWERFMRLSGGDPEVFAALCEGRKKNDQPVNFLVEGLIPRRYVTLLVGSRKTGKSTVATELAAVAGSGGGEWCGFTVPEEACKGLSLLLSGEDGHDILYERLEAMDPEQRADQLQTIPVDGRPIEDILADYENAPVSLLVVDPARKYLQGDEDSSDSVDRLFSTLESFAQRKGCAVVLVHHPKKGAPITSLAQVAEAARGSAVFLDRPRVTLGMVRSGAETVLGIPAPSGTPLHNLPARKMFQGQRRLVRCDETFKHRPIDQAAKRTGSAPEDAALEAVSRAAARLAAEGVKVTRTGQAGLYELRPGEIAGLSRAKVRAAIDYMLSDGRLVTGEDGGIVPAKCEGNGPSVLEAMLS
ncbi:hypothetical protein C882_3892 [Caenispirillum salinarum AK4]|uniref:Uncharacterized protein n=1 Tax=Caenispirillum salinarum AK4 TaxID=1238182 RepID=K9H388_9PROT|nr:AAA family ATPase [Caenispirillum salinarum]EKV31519.1 hypothetical protein C882_3892 [Caenispirillum salinarum AK4]